MNGDRDSIQQRERGKATVRALYLTQLQEIKKRRAAALREVEKQLDRLAHLLPSALDAGLTMSEIAGAAEVSRPTLYQLRARYSESTYDLRLALLQAVANFGRTRESELQSLMGGEAERIPGALDEMRDEGLIIKEFNEEPEDPAMEIQLTDRGFATLERWEFKELVDEREVAE